MCPSGYSSPEQPRRRLDRRRNERELPFLGLIYGRDTGGNQDHARDQMRTQVGVNGLDRLVRHAVRDGDVGGESSQRIIASEKRCFALGQRRYRSIVIQARAGRRAPPRGRGPRLPWRTDCRRSGRPLGPVAPPLLHHVDLIFLPRRVVEQIATDVP